MVYLEQELTVWRMFNSSFRYKRLAGGHIRFWRRYSVAGDIGVCGFEARFCGFLQHHGLRFLVLIIGGLRFADVVHGFSVAL